MKIHRADHLGMCFGVRDAITLAEEAARRQRITIFGELVHNPYVLERLQSRGIAMEGRAERIATGAVMITAHGASDKTRHALEARGLQVLEATCPLVHAAHRALRRLVNEGCYPIIIGKAGHVEVRGMTEDLSEFTVVLNSEDLDRIPARPRYGIVAQTTQPVDRVRAWVARIRERFAGSEVRFVDTVCQPTKLRQEAAASLARASTVVVVVGGHGSNNTRELVATCRLHCARVHHVAGVEELKPEWFTPEDVVGLTAGTSTTEEQIASVQRELEALARRAEPCSLIPEAP
jgi:4-hydroxy-3-methylbut-2-en-1-yl diphosphate reductase